MLSEGKELFPVTPETESLTVKKMIDGEWEVPWSIQLTLEELST